MLPLVACITIDPGGLGKREQSPQRKGKLFPGRWHESCCGLTAPFAESLLPAEHCAKLSRVHSFTAHSHPAW